MPKRKTAEPPVHKCGECRHYTPYTEGFFDNWGKPCMGSCEHRGFLMLRVERACDKFEMI